jgi:phosphoribosylaminoimidazolecarboxamide formyltransferase / IMP cyclohydrolase
MIQTALISVSDKSGIVPFARTLHEMGIKLVSTGGTAKLLAENNLPVAEVSSLTNFPEMLDGRVKTLHPMVHGGLLARRDDVKHMQSLREHGISTIDLLVINLYPFEQTIAQDTCTFADAIENIDIGGPAMLRAAAKNHQDVTVLIDPTDYDEVLSEIKTNHGKVSFATNLKLAKKVFAHTARYDGAIANYLSSLGDQQVHQERTQYPQTLHLAFDLVQELRYGENPHQAAAFYKDAKPVPGSLAGYKQLQGKELSFNNIADADAAWECVKSFGNTLDSGQPACVIVKHANPCGVAIANSLLNAYEKAFKTDPTSAFGGIIAFNRECDGITAQHVTKQFVEVLIAPSFTDEALSILSTKQNVRVLQIDLAPLHNPYDLKRVGGGMLLQSADVKNVSVNQLKVVTKKQPSPHELDEMLFAWKVAKYVKSNAIVFCANGMTLGVGAGQMSRLDSAKIAGIKAAHAGLSLVGSAVASDAFFPFRDGLDVVVAAGATCVIQPGGSMRDDEVVQAADEHGIVMVYTGTRHFRH